MQFQREPRSGKGYPHFAHWPDLDCDGNVYVSGYGFIHLDPQDIERAEIRRSASVAGGIMLMLLLLPSLLYIPAQLFVGWLAKWLPLETPQQLVLWNAILGQMRTDIWTYGSYLIPIFFLLGTGGREIRQRSNTAFPPVTAILAILCSLGLSGMTVFVRDFLNGVLQAVNLVEVNTSSPPVLPIAQMMYLMRTAVFGVILEEFLLRGLLLRVFRKHSDAFALMMTAIISGLTAGNLTDGLRNALLALMYGYMTLRTGSILVSTISHCLNVLWPELLSILLPNSLLAQISVTLLLITAGLIAFSIICLKDENAFILSSRTLDYARLSGQQVRHRSRFTFRKKLAISLTSAFFTASAALWLFQSLQQMMIVS